MYSCTTGTGGARIRDGVRSMNSESDSEYRIPVLVQSFVRDSFE
jgi:hypothetical protein